MLHRLMSLLIVFAVFGAVPAHAQEKYPGGTVKMIVGFAPGGGNDILARILADKLSEAFHQSFIVENKPGASGMLAIDLVKRAPPDGLTLLVGPSSGMTVNPVVYTSVSYDPLKDFAPISLVGYFPLIVTVHPSLKAQTIGELVALAKTEPGKINYSSAATSFQLATEMFSQMAGITMQNIPYKGSAPAINAVIANNVPVNFGDAAAVLPFVKAGTVRALAVTSKQRIPELPDVPTVAETIPGYEMVFWSGLFAPAGTPPQIVKQLQQEIHRIVDMPDEKKKLAVLGIVPAGTTGQELQDRMRAEIDRYRKVAESANIHIQQ